MNKKFVWTLLLLIVIGVGIFFLTKKPKEEVIEENEDEIVEETDEEEEVEEEPEYTGNTDFTSFSTDTQTLGEQSEATFSIESLEHSSKDGYHEFLFTLNTEDEEEPYVIASYLSNMSVIRLDFQGISKDSTGIGYQQEQAINKEGITKIYHNISAQSDQELYDIGVSKSTIFHLSAEEISEGEWSIILKIKYPGEITKDIDLGNEEFSTEDQEIEGIGATENASITSYTYGTTGGILKLVWSVSGDGDNPIPSVTASYNDEDELVVTFPSLSIDRVSNISAGMTLPLGIIATPERSGEQSIYTFTGMEGKAEYRISASLSPNQVILEIK